MDRIVNMIIRQVVSRAVGKGIDKGAEYMSARKSHDGKPADITPEQRKQVQRTSRNARQAMRVARRLGRF
mgnify:CR=1 FL=1|jgi:hypothetical protein